MRKSEPMSEPTNPPFSPGVGAIFEVVARLRAPGGCPWDREQTHESLRPYLLEETYELLEAIDSGDDAKIKEELGDLLLQVAMHAEIAAEQRRFDAAEEARELAETSDPKLAFEEMGDLLFAVVSLARRMKINPEDALRVAGQRFRRRFAETEASLRRDGVEFRDLDSEAIAKRWEDTKERT